MSVAGDVTVAPGIMGYTDHVSAAPGDTVGLYVSTTAASARAELVRLFALEIPGFGVPRREQLVEGVAAVACDGVQQRTAVGSYVRIDGIPEDAASAGLTVSVIVMPTRPGDTGASEAVVAQRTAAGDAGWSLGLDDAGRPRLWTATDAGAAEAVTPAPLVAGCWYRLTAVLDPAAGVARLAVAPVGTFAANRVATGRGDEHAVSVALPGVPVAATGEPLLLGCGWLADGLDPADGYDGRIEAPTLVGAPLADGEDGRAHPALLGAWDAAAGIGPRGFARPSRLEDLGPHARHGVCVNHPARGVTGHAWTGDQVDFRHAAEHYAALHVHRTDMTDCRWTRSGELVLPQDLPSGVYAIRLTDADGGEDRVPLIVRPPAGIATARALLVLSTNSYLAYGNDHVGVDSPRTQVWNQMVPALDDWERFRDAHRELGRSLYEVHSDGTGVFHSSWRRPLLTLRATVYDGDGPVWQFTGDLQLVDWLQRTGREVDVVCDRDVHEGGVELLSRYACVMTGTHPEYPTEEMLDAYEGYAGSGGRLMYMGGNGMYWVTGYDPEDDQVIEIRRWGATQAWCAAPGEYHLSFTGQQGGAWRFRGRPPQKTFGVGFVAAGGPSASAGYVRVAEPGSPAAWVLHGVEEPEFGRYGTMGGAAGIEIDAVDPLLGTPAETVVLATSVGHSDDMLEARENFNMTSRILGGARNARVHSDLVLVPREHGGAVFSTGSIGFSGSLAHAGSDNDVARLLGNVFDRFVSGAPVLD
ncbi:MAG TPA: N,N-dimethylformamidase beta subunit family domain-containing protein [Baekduia sp.]|nr:N,N-dimethylformamidase beta subunit family domain-containing protein [Baekduia sp.]